MRFFNPARDHHARGQAPFVTLCRDGARVKMENWSIDNVGARSAALGPGEVFTTQVTGSNGECIGIPNDATAVAFNMTIVAPTADSFLTLFPADLTTPPKASKASNLNWVAGQPPTPNKVDVKLSPDGKVKLFNNAGDVDVNEEADEGDASNIAGMQSFDISAGTNSRYHLMCRVLGNTDGAVMWSPQLTLVFIADR